MAQKDKSAELSSNVFQKPRTLLDPAKIAELRSRILNKKQLNKPTKVKLHIDPVKIAALRSRLQNKKQLNKPTKIKLHLDPIKIANLRSKLKNKKLNSIKPANNMTRFEQSGTSLIGNSTLRYSSDTKLVRKRKYGSTTDNATSPDFQSKKKFRMKSKQ